VIVLPGWYVEARTQPKIPVLASGNIRSYFKRIDGSLLTDSDIQRIAYQIDQKVRDLEPGELVRPLQVSAR
jgi:hypothetical protein